MGSGALGHWALLLAATAAFIVAPGVGVFMAVKAAPADPVPGIPPDGPAGTTHAVRHLLTGSMVGKMVTTNPVRVTKVSCPTCASATTAADFWVTEGGKTLRVHVPNTFQATYNVKKQNFVPAVGQTVVVQGRLETADGERYLQMKRFGERDHVGPSVYAYDVAAGRSPTGGYAWLHPVQVLNVGRWDDGDITFDVRDPRGGGLVRLEMSPPFYGQLGVPSVGDLVQPYGMVRLDPDHGLWEIHPVRCWSRVDCVPIDASYVRNGPPAGTPETGGFYLEGKEEPRSVPLKKEPGSA